MAFATSQTRGAVLAMALARYPAADLNQHNYETDQDKVFALLVDVAAAYADMLADDLGDRFARELDGEPVERTLADLSEQSPMETTVQALYENLEMRTPAGGGWDPV